jgi:hypothetical protein
MMKGVREGALRISELEEETMGRTSRLRAAQAGLVAAAVAQVAAAGLHFAMPSQLLGRAEFVSLSPAAHDFVTLGAMAVGVLLLGMAGLAMAAAVAARGAPGLAAAIALIQAAVWTARALLEAPWPLREPVLFLSEPSMIVAVGSLCLAAILGLAGLALAARGRGIGSAS